jgi:hypothetical protein
MDPSTGVRKLIVTLGEPGMAVMQNDSPMRVDPSGRLSSHPLAAS